MILRCLLLAAFVTAGAGCASNKLAIPQGNTVVRAADAELTRREFLFDVLRYLYLWHLDSETLGRLMKEDQIEIRVRPIEFKVDEGDRSQFAELWLPGAGLLLDLKQSDHEVKERQLVLRDGGFKIRAVHASVFEPDANANWTVVHLPSNEVASHLRLPPPADRLFPDATMEAHLRKHLADYLRQHHEREWLDGVQTFYAAPMSPVSNELWLYWENRRMALRFAADGDLSNPRLWEQLALHLRMVNLEEPPAVPPMEASRTRPGVSREWAGRLLYNCVVLGRKFILESPSGRIR